MDNEQNLLGQILVNNNAYWKASHLRADDFVEPVHQRIYLACQKIMEMGGTVSPLILKPQFDKDPALEKLGGVKYLVTLAKLALNVEDPKELADGILRAAQLRRIELVYQTATFALKEEKDPCELVAQTCMELEAAVSDATTKDPECDNDILLRVAQRKCLNFYSTGLHTLDTAMGGGLAAGKAYGFAAPKKSGKTALLATLAENLNQSGVKTLYVALEMGKDQIMERIAARRIKRNPLVFLREGRDFTPQLLASKSAGNLFFLDYAGVGFTTLKSNLLRAVRRGKYQVIIIDYWQLVGGKGNKESEREHLDVVAQWIAEFSKAYNVATVTASQVNQEGNTRGGEGMRLAFDQVYKMNRVELTTSQGIEIQSWFEMMDTRYTQWMNLGSETDPAFRINPNGVYFEEI